MNNNQVKLDGMVGAQHCNWQVSNSGSTIKLMWDIKSACLHFFICISLYQAVFMIPLSHLWVFGVNDILNIVCVPSHIWFFATPWTIACYASLSIEFSRQEYWFGLPFLTPGDLSQPGIEPMSPMSPALAARFYTTEPPEKPWYTHHTVPNIVALISLGNTYPVIRIFWTRAGVLIFLKRKVFFLLTLFPLFNFLNKSHNSPIRNLLFPVIKIKIPAHLHLHNSFGRLENIKQWMDKWTLTETRVVCQNPLLLQYYSLIHPKIYATRQ